MPPPGPVLETSAFDYDYLVSTATVNPTLHAIGYRYQRLRHNLTHSQDTDAVAAAEDVMRELQKGAAAEPGVRLVYVDECDIHAQPHLAKVWQRRGCPLSVPAAGKDQRRAVFVALEYGSGQVLAHVAPQKTRDRFAAFLAQIAQTWPDEHLVLVMNNVSYHRAPAMRAWWTAQDGRVTPFWLPAYTSNLNLVERV